VLAEITVLRVRTIAIVSKRLPFIPQFDMVSFGTFDARVDFTTRLAKRAYPAVFIIRFAARENGGAGQIFEDVRGDQFVKHG
jgi:hypothetical protein